MLRAVNREARRVSPLLLTFPLLPHLQLLGELRHDQEGLPALTLLGFEDVAEDVVPDVEDVLPFDVQQVADAVRRACDHSPQVSFTQNWLLPSWKVSVLSTSESLF